MVAAVISIIVIVIIVVVALDKYVKWRLDKDWPGGYFKD